MAGLLKETVFLARRILPMGQRKLVKLTAFVFSLVNFPLLVLKGSNVTTGLCCFQLAIKQMEVAPLGFSTYP